jgi:nicotinate-nucleotide pyrophosphorylase (carboxylating)
VRIWLDPEPAGWWDVVDDAVHEDVGYGDVTGGCLDPELTVEWYVEAQGDGIACGVGVADFLLGPQAGDPENASIEVFISDGDEVQRGTRVMEGVSLARRLVATERTALNFLMHLSGVATLTRQFVDRVDGTRALIVDTRKTLPGLRIMQKYAVRCGGGHNHRMGLYDSALIKENHIRAAGGIGAAVAKLRSYVSHMTKVEVECESLEEVGEAVAAGADVVLLDNMDPFMMREAVKEFHGRCLFEASGGISLDTVRGVAQTGVDIISVGALTHSAIAVPYHLEVR